VAAARLQNRRAGTWKTSEAATRLFPGHVPVKQNLERFNQDDDLHQLFPQASLGLSMINAENQTKRVWI
jgi:hypothetical protein